MYFIASRINFRLLLKIPVVNFKEGNHGNVDTCTKLATCSVEILSIAREGAPMVGEGGMLYINLMFEGYIPLLPVEHMFSRSIIVERFLLSPSLYVSLVIII